MGGGGGGKGHLYILNMFNFNIFSKKIRLDMSYSSSVNKRIIKLFLYVLSHAISDEKPKSVILDCTHVSGLDYTTIQGIIELIADFMRNDVTFALACASVSILFIV